VPSQGPPRSRACALGGAGQLRCNMRFAAQGSSSVTIWALCQIPRQARRTPKCCSAPQFGLRSSLGPSCDAQAQDAKT
jgi:hypothetical protein